MVLIKDSASSGNVKKHDSRAARYGGALEEAERKAEAQKRLANQMLIGDRRSVSGGAGSTPCGAQQQSTSPLELLTSIKDSIVSSVEPLWNYTWRGTQVTGRMLWYGVTGSLILLFPLQFMLESELTVRSQIEQMRLARNADRGSPLDALSSLPVADFGPAPPVSADAVANPGAVDDMLDDFIKRD
jgi:hypothetical protein